MSNSPRVTLLNYQTGQRTEVSARTAARVPAEINRRRAAEFRKRAESREVPSEPAVRTAPSRAGRPARTRT